MAENVGLPLGDKVLVVGTLMHRAWEPYRAHPQVLFWTGGRPEIKRRLKRNGHATFLPVGVKVILFSRFVGHSESDPIKKEAKRYGPEVIGPLDDGDITRRLAQLIPTLPEPRSSTAHVVEGFDPTEGAPAPPAAASPPTELRPFGRDEQRAFLQQHYDPHAPSVIGEARRLVTLAATQGVGTTEKSLEMGLNRLRKDLGMVKSREPGESAPPAPEPFSAPVPPQWQAPPTPPTLQSSDDPLVKILDDAVAGLLLVREELVHSRRDRAELLALKARLAELLK